jgi:hypothetical protein
MTTVLDVSEFARSLAGLTADPATPWRPLYLDLIAPGETPQRAAEMATMSGCGLVAAAIVRHFAPAVLPAPYRTGYAMRNIMALAGESRAVRPVSEPPQIGDLVIVGGGIDGGGPEHVWCCVAEGEGVDGGQVVNGYQAIVCRPHDVAAGWDSAGGLRRRVRAVINTVRVVARFG